MHSPEPYVGLAVYLLLCCALAAGLLGVAALLRYRVRHAPRDRHATYECGETPVGEAWGKSPVGFYLVALLFILFDVEAAFLFLWAQSLKEVGLPAFWEMGAFVAILLLGWVYAYRKGDLTWMR